MRDIDHHVIGAFCRGSFESLDHHRNQRAIEQAAEREWPSVVLEDVLDAEEIEEQVYFKPVVLNIGNIT